MTWTRRDFIRASAMAAAAGVLPFPAPLGATHLRDFRLLRRNVGIFSQSGGTIGWLVNDEGIGVVDSQFPDSARAFLNGLEGRGGRRLDVLVNTHHHGDHTGGNAIFREETQRIVAHARARELHAETAGPEGDAGLADETFQDAWSLEVGDERIHARHYGAAHTGGDCTVHFERADVVHMGDLVFNRAYPFIDRVGGASVQGWVDLIDTVVAEHGADTLFVFGHARPGFEVIGSREDLRVQGDFLGTLLELAEAAVQDGRSREEVMATASIPGFPDHRALNERLNAGAALAVAFDEVTGAE
ncbi:MAG: MBL fold metallo-hydrolase [Gemmatimonadales bacterium]|nr:MAG: MBL fold metallo-hydrolase [Gemmatimonadales bacterium]